MAGPPAPRRSAPQEPQEAAPAPPADPTAADVEAAERIAGIPFTAAEREQMLGALSPGAGGEPLWQSDLYRPPSANPTPRRNPVPDIADDELFTLLG